MVLTPKSILDKRLGHKCGRAVTQVFMKWLNAIAEDSTWEDLQDF